ncbi:MAG: hypothetical protein ABS910_01170 [Arthrobacter sp.]
MSIRTLLIASIGSVVAGFGLLTAVNASPVPLGALLSGWLDDSGQDSSGAYLAAIPQVFLVSAGIAALGCAAVFVLPRGRAPQPAERKPVSTS